MKTWAEKQLENNRAKYTLEYYLAEEQKKKDSVRKYYLVTKYKLLPSEYEAMLIKQKGVCAICGGTDKKRLAVDHCHDTQKIRGLLCTKCNVGLGYFKHNAKLLQLAIGYLKATE